LPLINEKQRSRKVIVETKGTPASSSVFNNLFYPTLVAPMKALKYQQLTAEEDFSSKTS
jgi:hypothetical protein